MSTEKLEVKIHSGPNKESLKQLIALRSAVLMPPNVATTKELTQPLPPGATLCYVGDVSTTNDIEIHADELLLLRGQVYDFKGKRLSISCRIVKFVGAGSEGVTFDLSGKDATGKPNAPSPRSKGLDVFAPPKPWNFNATSSQRDRIPYGGNMQEFRIATPGAEGEAGKNGEKGLNGGSFTFRGSFSFAKGESVTLSVRTRGGKGGDGGNGGAGGEGGDGIKTSDKEYRLYNNSDWNAAEPYVHGAAGGRGGVGGKGSAGGDGGNVDIVYNILVDGKESDSSNVFKLEIDQSPGANGSAGQGGEGGLGGDHTNLEFWIQNNNANKVTKWDFVEVYDPGFGREYHTMMKPGKMRRALNGSKGLDGPQITGQAHGGELKNRSRKSQPELLGLQKFNAHHLSMVLDRISFDYFTQYATQVYDPQVLAGNANTSALTLQQQAFTQVWKWVNDVLSQPVKAIEEEASAWRIPQATLLSFNAQCLARSDIFNRPLNAVPNPTVGIPDTRTALADFTFVEEAVAKANNVLQSSNRSRSDLISQMTHLTAEAEEFTAKRRKEQAESETLAREINDAIHLQDVRKDHLAEVAEELKKSIEKEVHCEIHDIVEAVSHVLMEAHEGGKAFAIGAVLSVGAAAASEWKKATETLPTESGGHVEKKFVYNRVDSLSSDKEKLRSDLQAALSETKENRKKDETYLKQIQVSAEKFDRMCDEYLSQIKPESKTKAVRDAFQDLMDSIQYKNQLIVQYNNCQARRLQLQANQDASDIINKKLKDKSGTISDIDLQLVGAFLTKAGSDIGKRTFEVVYYAARNFNCIALGPTTVFRALEPLQSFSGINATTLDTAVRTYLIGKDIATFEMERSPFEGKETKVSVKLDKKSVPEWFQGVKHKYWDEGREVEKEVRRFTYLLSASDPDTDFHASWWDVRLKSLEVYLPGAVQKEHHSRHQREQHTIGMRLSSPGVMTYKDRGDKTVLHNFQLPPLTTSFSYRYEPQSQGKTGFKPTDTPLEGAHMEFTIKDRQDHDRKVVMPMQSPFATWVVEPHEDVDLEGCEGVELVFSITHQTK